MKLFGEKGSSDFYGEMFRGEKGLLSTNLVSVFPFTDVLIWSVSKNKMCCQYFPKCSSRTSPPPKKKPHSLVSVEGFMMPFLYVFSTETLSTLALVEMY